MTRDLTPLGDRVVVELEAREQMRGGIVIPERACKVACVGKVVATGAGVSDDLSQGAKVYVQRSSGTLFVDSGKEYVILREGQVLAVIVTE
jgi:chaperonin GroES